MIISPPFLLDRNDDETDAAFVARCMPDTSVCVQDTNTPEGSFPISFKLGWHGGMHLQAPASGQTYLNVRAIADGEIVYARRPTKHNDNPSPGEPRNYNPYGDTPAWTDDGCVVIRHTTQIGANSQGEQVEVVFFSLYEHLSALRGPALQAAGGGQSPRVYRKDEIGVAGRVYGREHQLHLEIVCDDANLQRLINRRTGELNIGMDGRSDVVFGELYFRLPVGTEVFASAPLDSNPVAHHRPPDTPATQPAVPLAPAQTTTETYYIGLRYATGDGAANQRGHVYLSTYEEDGRPVGDVLPEPEAEYDLYRRATAISASYPENSRPAPSAVYELLRFGRIFDTEHETLTPANVPHWRRIRTPNGEGWVNLNADGVRKFSDADFPQWKGWQLIDDDTDADSRCESAMLTRLIEDPDTADGQLTRAELLQRLRLTDVRSKLKNTFCKFPTELNQATIQERWGWLVGDPEFDLSQDDFDQFAAHASALAIPWNEGWLPNTHWHLQPREFIATWRRCGWLSAGEFRQLVPKHAIRRHAQTYLWEPINTNITSATCIATTQRIPVNRMIRKYGINTPMRMASFFGNAIQETSWFSTLSEGGGNGLWYAPWFGRGFLQLTNPENYTTYWGYRGRTVPTTLKTSLVNAYAAIAALPVSQRSNQTLQDALFPQLTQEMIGWRNSVSTGQFDPSDSAGYYWSKLRMARYADVQHVIERVVVNTGSGQKYYYRSPSFWRASAAVNLPGAINNLYSNALNGFDSRCVAYGYAIATLSEIRFPNQLGQATFDFPEGYQRRSVA